MRRETRYDKGKASEALDSICLSSFEGSLEALKKTVQKLTTDYTSRFLKKTHLRAGRYCVADSVKEVQYTRLWIELGQDYEGQPELQVWGEREQHDDEIACLADQKKTHRSQQEQHERAELHRLQKKYK